MHKKRKYIINTKGKPVEVIMSVKEYEALMDDLEELALIRAYDKAKAEGGEIIDYKQAMEEIKAKKK